MDKDAVLIEQSIAKQYHILPSIQPELSYSDWAKLVSGLMDDTPLGRIVGIRSETKKEIIKNFTPEQNEIRQEWRQFVAMKQQAKIYTQQEEKAIEEQMRALEKMLASAFG